MKNFLKDTEWGAALLFELMLEAVFYIFIALLGGCGGRQEPSMQRVPEELKCKDNEDKISLMEAAQFGYHNKVRELLGQGADVNARDYRGNMALHMTIATKSCCLRHGAVRVWLEFDEEMACILLSAGAEIDSKDFLGHTPLHDAVSLYHTEAVLFFLNFGANPNEADSAGMTALHKLADTGRGFFTPDAQREIAELLISHAGKLETRAEAGFTPLHYATMKEHKSLIRQLVNAGADVNARNDYGWTAIDLAEDRGKYKDEELIALLQSLGGKRSIKEKDRKLLAAASGDVEAVKRLLAQGANFNFRDKHGETPLHRAAKFGGLETARLLITSGADVNAATMYGHTPLHDAAFWSHGTGVAELLVASGADIEARTGVGSTPLYEAVGWGNTQMVEFLIKAGADENAGNWRGETALHAAVEHGKKEVAAVLISYGADIAARDKKGRTPLDLAKKKRHTGIVKLLQDGR